MSTGGPVNLRDVGRLVADRLDAGPHGYFAGGAGDERTLADNEAAFSRRKLLPRVLVDVSDVTTATTVLGTEIALPVLVAPVALQRMAHPDGEPGMARAAAAAGTIMCMSTLATATAREVAAAAPDAPRWFQLYVLRDHGVTHALVDEAVACGYRALVVTVDAPRAGRRERDLRTGFAVPPGIDMPGITLAAGHSAGLTPADFFSLVDASLTWKDLERLVEAVHLPVLLKGIHSAADARLAIQHGAAGIVVSNHGGRQLDSVPAGIDLLEDVVQEVAGAVEVLVDGGVRRGTDVLVALALGARAVLVGRPLLWGLAWDGEDGARWILDALRTEIERDLTLLGAPSPAHVTRAHVV
ncbi:MAG TPA: alpha-hydroxy acid oxidase [Baekduia sp.]|uniref:alpha-hydroxy acid oxidase n=1 Tax=Baekduia sp. TaxID=2600305 RepID=UPI002C1B05E7|nr:alpha-hydroxy acid oxidase [Baekduia sp.]HMJ36937.1 alpha-hydroxy acid oxidase [Baekduia sp.]